MIPPFIRSILYHAGVIRLLFLIKFCSLSVPYSKANTNERIYIYTFIRCFIMGLLIQHEFHCVSIIGRSWRSYMKNKLKERTQEVIPTHLHPSTPSQGWKRDKEKEHIQGPHRMYIVWLITRKMPQKRKHESKGLAAMTISNILLGTEYWCTKWLSPHVISTTRPRNSTLDLWV